MTPLWNPYDVSAAIATHAALPTVHQTPRKVATGSYSGDDGADRQIVTGFKCGFVIVMATIAGGNQSIWVVMPAQTFAQQEGATQPGQTDVQLHATDGFRVWSNAANATAAGTYYWWAISE